MILIFFSSLLFSTFTIKTYDSKKNCNNSITKYLTIFALICILMMILSDASNPPTASPAWTMWLFIYLYKYHGILIYIYYAFIESDVKCEAL